MSLKDSLRVMVVDDMSTSRGILTQCLDELGVKNYMVENNGQSAFQKITKTPVHLVLSDYNMPGMDGLGLLQAVRGHQVTQRVGFILVTGKPTPEIIEVGKKLGLNNIIRKPFTVATMKQAIEQVVGRL
ncbi:MULTISPECIES: response regulator [Rhodobacterales]|jgi:two-component system chemotaxis response regulator CheY|uniref:Response regulator n=1 Tax=Phaeobacter gallaeciensis TaxID=60890 RepID=A0AAW6L1G9_9RHOB|nr:response regulator [Phaeobacter gallaeciensis]MDF1773630.1 response regulator [Pseudophaeobacter sp. bin_em_oilr2.035]MEE2634184.1 response regulator [Pseudomonadota bacterium]MDE4062632.1 response regulator [Phaeobacter gallaeciensis]MDE4097154.1 response regulator [Phaeobacter gallaeciensis]MDE4106332.1 response regulator [Phaeobacter gallaeciensis]